MSDLPDLAALRLVVGVGRRGSIGAAARAAGVTQQAASERLRSLEAQTGLTLLRRGARGSQLTPQGVVLAEWSAHLLEVADEVAHAIDGLRGERSRELTVWSSMTVAESLLPRWLVALRQRQEHEGHRPTAVSLHAANSSQVITAVRDGVAHVGFVEGAETPTGVASAEIASDELVLVAAAGSPLTRRRSPLGPDELAELPLTNREPGSGTREVVEDALAAHGLGLSDAGVELTTATAIREAVLAGSFPALLSRRVVARELESGRLVEVPTEGLALSRLFRAVWIGTTTPPAGPVRDLVAIARTAH